MRSYRLAGHRYCDCYYDRNSCDGATTTLASDLSLKDWIRALAGEACNATA